MTTFISSLLVVSLAKMGARTQQLAIAIAAHYAARTVLAAVFTATLVNHAVAVAAPLAQAIGIVPNWPAAQKVRVSARSCGGIGQRW
jgi:putative Ca2+/H+ antiporter (TMEM165/GDT1 family)